MDQRYIAINVDKREYLEPPYCVNLQESCHLETDFITFVDALTALLKGPWHGDRVMYISELAWSCNTGGLTCSGAGILQDLKENGVIGEVPYSTFRSWRNAAAYCYAPKKFDYVLRHELSSNSEGSMTEAVPAEGEGLGREKMRFVVNETQRVYYDREKLTKDGFGDAVCDPLLIFLAVGSGLGGGDYHRDEGAELVGSWACQTISASNERPEGLREIANPFDPNA